VGSAARWSATASSGRSQRGTALALCSLEAMAPAHRIYERMGFARAPERDWQPVPGLTLVSYLLQL